ncbi:MAG TPA: type 1 glutamine amidotransferase [Malonomonas sp.]
MRIQVLQFDERVGLGTFSGWLAEAGSEITCWRCDQQQLPGIDDRGPVILLGGYMGVGDRQQLPYLQLAADWVAAQVEAGRPLLAICLGGQLLAHALGGSVTSQYRQEKGIAAIELTPAGQVDPLFAGLPNPFCSFEWHNDSFDLPQAATHLAWTEPCPGQAFRYQNAWGLQFHPEVDTTIVAQWCQRTGAGEKPQQIFHQHQQRYLQHSRQLLLNFLQTAQSLL